jgi:Lrp/AsnC family transcriptional regulator for asnA, asnC and gidA
MGPSDSSPLDAIDRDVVRILQKNGRTPNTEIGRQLGLTETTIRKRIARLLEDGLLNIVAVPTPRATGWTTSAIIGVSVRLGDLNTASKELASCPEVRYLGLSTGRYDLILEAFFADSEHLLEFVSDRLGSLAGVTSVETSIILRVDKFSYEWEL